MVKTSDVLAGILESSSISRPWSFARSRTSSGAKEGSIAAATREVAQSADVDPSDWVVGGGEDYELLFTIGQDDYDKVKGNPNFTVIGHMTEQEEGVHLITRAGEKVEMIAQGWNSLKE